MKRAQNLIEFVYIFPLVVFLSLAIFELALFWRDVNFVNMANEEIAYNIILNNQIPKEGENAPQVEEAAQLLAQKAPVFAQDTLNFDIQPKNLPPYTVYKIISREKYKEKPRVEMDIDFQNPQKYGITTQLRFEHPLRIMRARIPALDGSGPIEIFPSRVLIVSTKKRVKN